MKRSQAFQEGFAWFTQRPSGLRISNPYPTGSQERRDWFRGWMKAHATEFPPPKQLEVHCDADRDIHRIKIGKVEVRTLSSALSRSKTHVTAYLPATDKHDSEDTYLKSSDVVELIRGFAPGNVIVDALLEIEDKPKWLTAVLEKAAKPKKVKGQ